jgi:hypothetical protein
LVLANFILPDDCSHVLLSEFTHNILRYLKDFADENGLLAEYADEYPGYYLDKKYRYFVCKQGVSFDSKGEGVMTHGGMTLDEVIVPFVKIKGVK